MKAIFIKSLAILAIATSASGASAKDWIQKVDIVKDGIDTIPIEVRAGSNTYTKMKTLKHRFLLRGYAKAKSGKVIYGASWYSNNNGAKTWEKKINTRGYNRELKASFNSHIPLSRVSWVRSPVKSCRDLLHAKMAQGMSRKAVLSKKWTVNAVARFGLQVSAKRKINAKKPNSAIDFNAKATNYIVKVRCLIAPNPQNQLQSQQHHNNDQGSGKILKGALKATQVGLGITAGFKGNRPSGSRPGRAPGR